MSIREIEIQDERDDKILISIWEDCLPQLDIERIEHESRTQHVVLAFSSLQLIYFSNKWSLKTYSATRIYQELLPEILAFQQRMIGKKIQLMLIENAGQGEQSHAYVPMTVSIAKLKEICPAYNQDKLFNAVAKITDLLDEFDWYYNACPTHKTRTKYAKPHYISPHCWTKIEMPEPWYNFILLVKDATGEAEFFFIGRRAEHLLGSLKQNQRFLQQLAQEMQGGNYSWKIHQKGREQAVKIAREKTRKNECILPPQKLQHILLIVNNILFSASMKRTFSTIYTNCTKKRVLVELNKGITCYHIALIPSSNTIARPIFTTQRRSM